MISFAGIPLESHTPELLARATRHIDPRDFEEFAPRDFSGRLWIPPRTTIGRLVWPRGASRFSYGWFIATPPELRQIRAACYTGADQLMPRPLVLDDDFGTKLTAEMYLLSFRPLSQPIGDGRELYLMTLVDERWHWQFRSSAITLTPGTSTWDEVYDAVADALGITLTHDPVASAYLFPSGSLARQHESLPRLLDDIAATVGQRIVRSPDGTVHAWGVTESQAQVRRNLGHDFDKLAGGTLDLERARGDLPAILPETVRLVFPLYSAAFTPGGANYGLDVDLEDLALPEYRGLTGFSGVKTVPCQAVALGLVPANLAELTLLARQAATDYYRWQAARLDLQLISWPAWTLEGTVDLAVYHHETDEGGASILSTRLMRGPWEDGIPQRGGGVLAITGSGGSSTPVTVEPINTIGVVDVSNTTVNVSNTTVNVSETDLNLTTTVVVVDQSSYEFIDTDITIHADTINYFELTTNVDSVEVNYFNLNFNLTEVHQYFFSSVIIYDIDTNIYIDGKLRVDGGLILPDPPEEFIIDDDPDLIIRDKDGALQPVAIDDVFRGLDPVDVDVTDIDNYFITVTPPGSGPSVRVPVSDLPSGAPAWQLIKTITHEDLTAASTGQDVFAYSLPVMTGILALFVHVREPGGGGGATSLTMAILKDGALTTSGVGNGMEANNVNTCINASATDFAFRTVQSGTAATTFAIRFTSDVNVVDLTQGIFDVHVLLTGQAGS